MKRMNTKENILVFFRRLQQNAGAIWLHEGRIRLSAPTDFQNEDTYDFIKSNKAEILSILEENRIHDEKRFLNRKIWRDLNATNAPLSSAQERLWFIEQFETGTNAYHLPGLFELEENTSIDAVRRAIRRIVERHEILRSTIGFTSAGDNLARQIVLQEQLPVDEKSFTTMEDAEACMRADINRPFNLTKEFPIRVVFYQVSGEQSEIPKRYLLINTHHIASDGWSLNIFQNELRAYYDAFVAGDNDFDLPELEIQYKDYAAWQKKHFDNGELQRQLNFWKEKLDGFEPLTLPLDYTRPAKIDYKGGKLNFRIDETVSAGLRRIASEQGTTLFSVLLGSLGMLLGKYSGQQDIVIGSPVAN